MLLNPHPGRRGRGRSPRTSRIQTMPPPSTASPAHSSTRTWTPATTGPSRTAFRVLSLVVPCDALKASYWYYWFYKWHRLSWGYMKFILEFIVEFIKYCTVYLWSAVHIKRKLHQYITLLQAPLQKHLGTISTLNSKAKVRGLLAKDVYGTDSYAASCCRSCLYIPYGSYICPLSNGVW